MPWEDWPRVLQDQHAGYLSWEQLLRNRQQLNDNRTFRAEERRGAVREGRALLQGLVRCGTGGRRMRVRSMEDGIRPIYVCDQRHNVRWQTHACSTLAVARPKPSCEVRRTAPAVVVRGRELAPSHTDEQSADCLNAAGFTRGQGGICSASKVNWIRYVYHIKRGCPPGPAACSQGQRGDGRYRAQAAAALLTVTVSTGADWGKAGKLDGIQAAPHGPWWVKLAPDAIATLRKPVQQHWAHRRSAGSSSGRKRCQP